MLFEGGYVTPKKNYTFEPANIWSLLKIVAEEDASDLFITVGVPPSMKVDGKLFPLSRIPLTKEQVGALVYGVMTPPQARDFEEMLEINFAISHPQVGRFRVNVFQQQNEVGMVLRRIKTDIPTVEALGLPSLLNDLAMAKRGMVLMVGATSSGKSTSLAAMIGYRNKNSQGHIVSIEDPVEYVHTHQNCIVTQREVGIDTHSFDNALKNTLRQAPDVIMIGEVRSRETMEHAISFAETGHLVLTTLHATNAQQALDRIVHFFPEDRRQQLMMDLSLNLKAIVAQRLVPMASGTGRRVATEILVNTPLVSDLIMRGEIHLLHDVMKKSTQQGMRTFDYAVYDLYKTGDISYDDAVLYADSPNEVRLMIKLGSESAAQQLGAALEGVTLEGDEDKDKEKGTLYPMRTPKRR